MPAEPTSQQAQPFNLWSLADYLGDTPKEVDWFVRELEKDIRERPHLAEAYDELLRGAGLSLEQVMSVNPHQLESLTLQNTPEWMHSVPEAVHKALPSVGESPRWDPIGILPDNETGWPGLSALLPAGVMGGTMRPQDVGQSMGALGEFLRRFGRTGNPGSIYVPQIPPPIAGISGAR